MSYAGLVFSICSDGLRRDQKKKQNNNFKKKLKRVERESSEEKGRRRGGSGMLTLDVDRDTGLLAVGDRLVGRLTDDLLTCLDVGRR